MSPGKNAEREAREARDRLRRYTARQTVHRGQLSRRRLDNISSIIVVVIVATLATVTQVIFFTSGPGMPEAAPSASPSPSADAGEQNTGDVPPATIAENRAWTGNLLVNQIDLGIRIDGDLAPQAASVFISLAQSEYYTQNACHRLTTAAELKVIQCGRPNETTSIDPGFAYGPIENTPDDGVYPAGTIAMARGDSLYSQGPQFFITYEDSYLDPVGGGYTVFGAVTSGLDQFVAQVAAAGVAPAADGSASSDGAPAVPTIITSVTLQ